MPNCLAECVVPLICLEKALLKCVFADSNSATLWAKSFNSFSASVGLTCILSVISWNFHGFFSFKI